MAKLVSKVYGDALLETALEKRKTDELYQEVSVLKTVFRENPDLVQLLNHPKIVKEEKISIMERIFSGKISEELMGFLTIIVDKGRQNDIFAALDYFLAAVKEYKRIGIASVASALPLSDAQKTQIEKKLLATTTYRTFEMHYEVDASLIGGLVVRIGDRVVDGSIRTRLYELKRELSKTRI